MKFLALWSLVFTFSTLAATKPCKTVYDYSDSLSAQYARHFPIAQENQLKTLSTYAYVLKTQVARLMSGMTLESRKATPKTMKLYQDYLGDLLFSYTYVTAHYQQLKAYDIKTACGAFEHQQIEITVEGLLKSAGKAEAHGKIHQMAVNLGQATLKGIAENALQDIAMGAGRQFKTMLVQRAVASGIKAIASNINGRTVGKLLVGAAKGVVVGFVIDQLKGGKIPETTQWVRLIREDLELQLNPEWMRNAGLKLQLPWYWHMMTWRNEEDQMLAFRIRLARNSENTFINRVRYIYHIDEHDRKAEEKARFLTSYAESTGVRNVTIEQQQNEVPYWAKKN